MRKIVITGGPCAGKTTALSRIREHLSRLGVKHTVVPEAATLVFDACARTALKKPARDREFAMLRLQLSMEDALSQVQADVMVLDRGALDNKAYVSGQEWTAILSELGVTEAELMSRYDAIIHMVTAAIGAEECYRLDGHRIETRAEAAKQDADTQAAWLGHGHLRIIPNGEGGFEAKIRAVCSEISHALGIPSPLELERKFLLDNMPSVPAGVAVSTSRIVQDYLVLPSGSDWGEERVRARTYPNGVAYTHTFKSGDGAERIEAECGISASEYLDLLDRRDPKTRSIIKDRTCFVYDFRVHEIDTYLSHPGLVTLEVEVNDLAAHIYLPEWVGCAHEVTGTRALSNRALATNPQLCNENDNQTC